jgi:hypothetical protein
VPCRSSQDTGRGFNPHQTGAYGVLVAAGGLRKKSYLPPLSPLLRVKWT